MSVINFSNGEISLLRLHYLQEYNNTRKKLEDIISILKKLGVSDASAEAIQELQVPAMTATQEPRAKRAYNRKSKTAPAARAAAVEAEVAKPRKRGRKPKKISWAKFAVKTLNTAGRPLSAREILEAGADQFGVTDANRTKAMQALQATLFRLTKKSNQLSSSKEKGSYVTYSLPQ